MEVVLAVLIIGLIWWMAQCRAKGRPLFRASSTHRTLPSRRVSKPAQRPTKPQGPWLNSGSVVRFNPKRMGKETDWIPKAPTPPNVPWLKGTPKKPQRETIAPHTIARLDSLTRDRATSVRLVRQVKQQHRGRGNNWCAEKAIYDLERDRLS